MGDEFHFIGGDPEEIRRKIEEQQQRHEMMYDDAIHSLYRAIEEMDVDHLKQVKMLLHNLGDTPQAIGFWEGVMSTTISRRENLCLACGKDHDKALEEMRDQQNTDPSARADRIILMHEYHVEPVDDDDLLGKVRCIGVIDGQEGCGLEYPNLEDRMVKKPGDCHGCFTKSAQG